MPRKTIADRLNETSRLSAVHAEGYTYMKLDPEQLVPSEENFYEMRDIEELADNMLSTGVIEPIVIGRVNGEDRIISGHRRREAAILNKRAGHKGFDEVPCLAKEMTQNMFMFTLISANAFTRRLNSAELIRQAEMLRTYVRKLKEEDGVEIHGKMRDFIADTLGVSHTKMAQMESISNNLSDEGKAALNRGEINFSKAYETSKLPEERQHDVIADGSLLSCDVKKIAQDLKDAASASKPKTLQKPDGGNSIPSLDEEDHFERMGEADIAALADEVAKYRDYARVEVSGGDVSRARKYKLMYYALRHYYLHCLRRK